MARMLLHYSEAVLCLFAGLMCALNAALFVTKRRYLLTTLALMTAVLTITHAITMIIGI